MPAELTPDLYRMSMWQVDQYCWRHPKICKSEVISFVHEQLAVAAQKFDPEVKGAKLTSWFSVATRMGIQHAAYYLSSRKQREYGIYAKKFSELADDKGSIAHLPFIDQAARADDQVATLEILYNLISCLGADTSKSFFNLFVKDLQPDDYEKKEDYESDAKTTKNVVDALSKMIDPKNGVKQRNYTKKCQYCGKTYSRTTEKAEVYRAKKFCSRECHRNANRDLLSEKSGHAHGRTASPRLA